MIKKLKWMLIGVAAIFLALQFFNPPHTNPPVKTDFTAATSPPASVSAAIHAACYDCHSYETKWPLYSRIAPISFLIASDVNEGRKHLNLSEWSSAPAAAAKNLDRMNEVIDYKEMPPSKYTMIHADARLSDAQRKEVLDWTEAAADKLRGTTNN